MGDHNQGGLRRIVQAARYSWQGINAAWNSEAAFRQEVLLCLVLIPAAFWLGVTALERALLIGVCLLVLVIELLNSAIESAINRISEEHHPLSGRAKDMGSAAVLFGLLIVVVTWGLIGYARFAAL